MDTLTKPNRGEQRYATAADQKAAIVAAVRETGSVLGACQRAGLPRSTHYHRLKADPDYRAAIEDALARGRRSRPAPKGHYSFPDVIGALEDHDNDSRVTGLRVVAIRRGVYGGRLRREGSVFDIDPVRFAPSWMRRAPDRAQSCDVTALTAIARSTGHKCEDGPVRHTSQLLSESEQSERQFDRSRESTGIVLHDLDPYADDDGRS